MASRAVKDGRGRWRAVEAGAGWLAGQCVWERTGGLLVMPDGALLVSDDSGSRIWRVTYGK